MTASEKTLITIVSGLPRSGTSMMMRMLTAGGMPILSDQIRKPDAHNPHGYYEYERVKQLPQDTLWLADAAGKAVKMVYRLLYDLPLDYTYRVIFMERQLDECIRSQRTMLQAQNRENDSPPDEKLKAIYQIELKRFDSWIRGQENFSLLPINYNNTVNNPEETVLKVRAFVGNNLDTNAMIQVIDPQLYRQRAI